MRPTTTDQSTGAPNKATIPATSDAVLLARYTGENDPAAFRALVDRHLPAVHAVALRKTSDHHLAQDVSQKVFAALARRARKLRPGSVLPAWLHRVATTEAAETLRREYRHRRTMAKLHDSAHATGSDAPPPALFAALDDAVQTLPRRDREAVLLRYAAGHSYGELGTALGGRSADAARKTVDRAVEKLKKLLARKGVTVPAAVLSTALGTAFTAKLPATLASTVSTTALAAAAVPLHLQILAAMADAKLKLAVAAAAVLAVSATSFVTARTRAADFAATAQRSIAQRPAAAPALPAPAEDTSTTSTTPAPAAPVPGAHRILRQAADILEGPDDSSVAYARAQLLVARLTASDVPDALTFIESLPDDGGAYRTLAPLVLGVWARDDGAAAMAYAESDLHPDVFSRATDDVLPGWSRTAPHDALAWFHRRSASGDLGMNITSFRWLASEIFEGWADTAPTAALEAVAALPVEDERAAALGIADAHDHSLDPLPIRDAVRDMPPSAARTAVARRLAEQWAREEPHAAAAWVDSLAGIDPDQHFALRAEIAEEWLRYDRSSALDIGAWLISGAPEKFHETIAEGIRNQLDSNNSR